MIQVIISNMILYCKLGCTKERLLFLCANFNLLWDFQWRYLCVCICNFIFIIQTFSCLSMKPNIFKCLYNYPVPIWVNTNKKYIYFVASISPDQLLLMVWIQIEDRGQRSKSVLLNDLTKIKKVNKQTQKHIRKEKGEGFIFISVWLRGVGNWKRGDDWRGTRWRHELLLQQIRFQPPTLWGKRLHCSDWSGKVILCWRRQEDTREDQSDLTGWSHTDETSVRPLLLYAGCSFTSFYCFYYSFSIETKKLWKIWCKDFFVSNYF